MEKVKNLPASSEYALKIFTMLARDRLADAPQGWLKPFRDSLLHETGKHSANVIPQKKSLETTRDLWDKMKDEHNWLREAMIVALASFLLAGLPTP